MPHSDAAMGERAIGPMRGAAALLRRARPHLRNASWSTCEYLFYPLLMLAATPLLVASLGTGDFGLLMLVNSLAGLSASANFGMSAATIKFISACTGRQDRDGAGAVIRATLWMSVAGGALVSVALCLAAPWLSATVFERMGDTREVELAIYFAAAVLMLMQVDGVFSSTLKGLERFALAARLEMVFRSLGVCASVAVAWLTGEVVPVLATLVLSSVVSTAVRYAAVRGALGRVPLLPRAGDFAVVREVTHFGVWSWITSMGSMLFVHADRLLIGSFLGAHALAYYSVCVQLAQQVHQVPASGMSILFPLISRKLHAGEHDSARRVRNAGIAANLGLSFALGLAMLALGPWLLRLWMGAEFAAETGDLMLWLTLAYFLLSLNVAPHFMLMGYNEMRYVSIASLAGGALGVIAALVLLPAVGLAGAAQARLVLGLTTLANYWRVYRPASAGEPGVSNRTVPSARS